jgi:hypothetical protein
MKICNIILVFLALTTSFSPAEAGGFGKLVGRAIMKKTLRADLIRDRATVAKTLTKPRTVFRYTSRVQSAREAKQGLAPRTHMTSTAGPGRPLSAQAAQKRYGLPSTPQVRETLRLDGNQAVKLNKALGGQPGYGELTSPKRISPKSIRRIIPLR